MPRIHPTESRIDAKELAAVSDHRTSSVWTVWKKSSMAFQGTDGFSVYDGEGRLAFRVDNYSRRHKLLAGELVLMDGAGKPLYFLRPQLFSMYDKWNAFKGEDGSKTRSKSCVFSMQRRSVLQNSDEAKVFLNAPEGQTPVPDFRFEGHFWKRCCKIKRSTGEAVAKICRKKVNTSMLLSDDVFSLIIEPGVDCDLIVAFIVVMDRICQKPFTPLMCS